MRKFNVNVNGKDYIVEVEEVAAGARTEAPVQPAAKKVEEAPKAAPVKAAGNVKVEAPMNGTILDVKVSAGQQVKSGDVLCILEAMKMENEIVAPQDGTVTSVVAKGATVNAGDLLASME